MNSLHTYDIIHMVSKFTSISYIGKSFYLDRVENFVVGVAHDSRAPGAHVVRVLVPIAAVSGERWDTLKQEGT